MNDINYSEIEADFIAGWKCWCKFGYLDTATCMESTDNGDVRRSFEFRDGYEAAARANDLDGDRPRSSEAAEYAAEYVARLKTDACAHYRAVAD